ncbi:MAG: 3'-5' exonuclease [Candidatus Schekmanbacteria bacterium]|nr:3'-5' exonuclease [Candidatus Schekmanbacteria bacterium]
MTASESKWARLSGIRVSAASLARALAVDTIDVRPLAIEDLPHPYAVGGVAHAVARLLEAGAWNVSGVDPNLACRAAVAILSHYAPTGNERGSAAVSCLVAQNAITVRSAEASVRVADVDTLPRLNTDKAFPLSAPTLAFALVNALSFATAPGLTGDSVVLDLETTGLDSSEHEIVEIGAIKLRHGFPVDVFQSLVRPHKPISEEVSRINHISNEMLRAAPAPEEIFPQFAAFLSGARLVAHNAAFDIAFLRRNLAPYGAATETWEVADTLALSRLLLPISRHSLEAVAAHLGLELPAAMAHRALPDARITASVYVRLRAMEQKGRAESLAVAAVLAAIGNLDPRVVVTHLNRRIAAIGLRLLRSNVAGLAALGPLGALLPGARTGRALAGYLSAKDCDPEIRGLGRALVEELGLRPPREPSSLLAEVARPIGGDAQMRIFLEDGTAAELLGWLRWLAPFGRGNPCPLIRGKSDADARVTCNRLASRLAPLSA